MIIAPRKGQAVIAWYKNRDMPFHAKTGTVIISGRGKPRNHLIKIGEKLICIPCGNINSCKTGDKNEKEKWS